ncbi:amino acid adenylation domain-containing protein [Streptomyces sp. NBC_01498]|uniref:amino acid adenylation domain-containing protein n=1 Tax=Streptomyces sp. NBC_01498 TaxID=2975870 RepID=UPI002E7B449F|nr:amino acid adenylation domain-containing protein [Streptomyces sp. NBC_01498]WTL23416.1 amino acid adenylation domain-containing protein [Streptomyces sp. NBC_01498]
MSGPVNGGRPLNEAQSGVWYAQRMDPLNPVFNMGGYLEINGPADPELLKAAVTALVAEDETARLTFSEADGVPRQHFGDAPDFTVELLDVSAEPDPVGAARQRMLDDLAAVPDLERGPLFHHLLFAVGPDRWFWYNRAHHLINDGYSATLMRRRAAELYASLAGVAGPGTPYGSFERLLADQDAYAESKARARDAAYWKNVMAGAEYPAGPGPAGALTHRISRRISSLDEEGFGRLVAFGERAGISWQQAVLAAAVLHRRLWTGDADVLLSLPVSGRLGKDGMTVPGMMANVIPLRCRVDDAETCEEFAARVAALTLRAQWHQRYDAADLMRDLGWPANGRRRFGPVVNIVVAEEQSSFAGIPAVGHLLSTGGTAEDLSLTVSRGPDGGLRVDFTIDEAYGESVDLSAYERTFHQILASMTADPGVLVGAVEVMSSEERELVLRTWNDTVRPVESVTLGGRFEEQAARTPDATALIFNDEHVSYGELNERANRLAHQLMGRHGVRRGQTVGVLVERGITFATALVAVTKTGATYAVLDPDFPDERLALITRDARPVVVLTHGPTGGRVSAATLDLDALSLDTPYADEPPVTNPVVGVHPEDAATIMYTSGSTGRPKAILTPHRALTGTVLAQDYAEFGPGQRFLQCSPVSWDAFSLEFWGALLHGATTVLQPGQRPEPTLINQLAHHHRITMLQLSSSLFNYLTDEHPDTFTHTQHASTGGEPASPTHTHHLKTLHPHLTLTNGYGPAESMGYTTTHTLPTTEKPTHTPIPIGHPVTNKHAYILNTHLQPVPPGVTGELYLAGTGLAHGYQHQPTLTATHFIPHPYGPPGTRLYRTGDLAHQTPDGQLHYHGRTDHQIKIRGFRIEPTEIHHALLQHPHVTQATTTTTTHPNGTTQLNAYTTLHPHHHTTTPTHLRHHLQTTLPHHLIPTTITILPKLPLTPNGKIDHKALPTPHTTTTQGRPPRTPQEEILCTLYTQTLNLTHPTTIDDNFFDLGGHSLLAAKLTTHIRTTLHTNLTIRDIFQNPTPATLTHHITTLADGPGRARPRLTAGDRPDRLPLSYAQRRLWFLAALGEQGTAYNVPLSVRIDGELDTAALRAAFGDVVARHEVLRTRFEVEQGEPYQRVLAPEEAPVVFEEETVDADGLAERLRTAAGHTFDLSAELPLRVSLFHLGDGTHVLLVLLHHIATDGQSLRPLFDDLSAAYASRRAGTAPGWTPLPVQYADYALWQHRLLGETSDDTSLLAEGLAFWREALEGLPEELGLVLDRPRPAVAGQSGDAVVVDFGPELRSRVVELARAERCTVFMVLQAALAATLTRMGAGEDIPLGSPVAGRTDDALGELVGFFVNTLVLRTDTSGNPSFRELLERVRTADLDAFAHQETPFDLVIEATSPVRSLSRHPLFQICLALESGAAGDVRLAGTRSGPATFVDNRAAKFDLEFLLREDADAGITGAVVFSTDIYDRSTVERLVEGLSRFLDQVTADPGVLVGAVEVMSSEERELVLHTWNDTVRPVESVTLGGRFEEQAARTPEATALIFNDEHVSYRELNERANRLAHQLMDRHGVRRGQTVGVLVERGITFATALVAVTKTGATYAVLDPDFPEERLRLITGDARPVVVLTHRPTHDRLTGLATLDLDALDVSLSPVTDPETSTHPEDAATIMYTSGSTGRPKAILTPHRALTGTVLAQDYAEFGPGQRFLQCSPVSWDAFSLEFWGALLHGATTVLQPGQRPEPTLINQLAHHHRITMLQLSSSLFNYLTDEHPDTFTHTQHASTGGEPASPTHTHHLKTLHPHLTLTNGYGPAESMGYTTTHTLPTTDTPTHTPIPIGHPVTNKHAYILNTHLQPVPPGVTGELYLAGTGLAHGYQHQPTLTATHFIPHPYGPPGTRLYRTGDLAHQTPDGQLHYHGRTDHQIKIRGFRIEPTEIHHALLQHPHVTQATTTTTTHPNGTTQLNAYTTLHPHHHTTTPTHLRHHLQTTLPHHLIPTTITILPKLPLTPNGKIDHKALPTPHTTTQGRPPRTPQEEILCTLYTQTLNLTHPTTIDDNFFDLGGHSLLAAKLTTHIRTTLHTNLTIRDIFQNPTPATLTHHITTLQEAAPRQRKRPTLRRRTEAGTLLSNDGARG